MSYVSRKIHTRQCCCTVCTNVGCNCHTAFLLRTKSLCASCHAAEIMSPRDVRLKTVIRTGRCCRCRQNFAKLFRPVDSVAANSFLSFKSSANGRIDCFAAKKCIGLTNMSADESNVKSLQLFCSSNSFQQFSNQCHKMAGSDKASYIMEQRRTVSEHRLTSL